MVWSMSPTQKFEPRNGMGKKMATEVIQEDVGWEYGEVVAELKDSYEEFIVKQILRVKEVANKDLNVLKEKYDNEKVKNKRLEEENISLTKEYEKQCNLIMSQNELIKELKKKFEEDKANTLIMERDKLSKENVELEQQVKQLKEELNKAKEPANTQLRENSTTKTRNALKQFNTAQAKPKIKKPSIPKLDFSKLPQKEQALLKVIQCKETSMSSSEDNIEVDTKEVANTTSANFYNNLP
eukprot:TRINITY_DN3895_c0_g2_i1.p1 TRINITY_DN3895_c0_g2~~TRINITY_DN3895_c0_g2_i1.p1  ORF type:complete len:240 (+),score=74.27 TRINITY_DN3895_c0_g2_i1:474-1193(+)